MFLKLHQHELLHIINFEFALIIIRKQTVKNKIATQKEKKDTKVVFFHDQAIQRKFKGQITKKSCLKPHRLQKSASKVQIQQKNRQ